MTTHFSFSIALQKHGVGAPSGEHRCFLWWLVRTWLAYEPAWSWWGLEIEIKALLHILTQAMDTGEKVTEIRTSDVMIWNSAEDPASTADPHSSLWQLLHAAWHPGGCTEEQGGAETQPLPLPSAAWWSCPTRAWEPPEGLWETWWPWQPLHAMRCWVPAEPTPTANPLTVQQFTLE